MGAVQVGDALFDESGRQCRVTFATEVMRGHECYRVGFSDGTYIVADAEHQWVTRRRETRRPNGKRWRTQESIRTTRQIADSLYVSWSCAKGLTEYNHTLRAPAVLDCPQAELPVDPYVLGTWLGDGRSDAASITCCDEDIAVIKNINALGTPTHRYPGGGDRAGQYRLGNGDRSQSARRESVQAKLRLLGVLRNKHIPTAYLRAKTDQRRELLRGLMDTDGYASKAGQCEFTTTSPKLRDGFMELARSLGYKPTLKTARATCRGKDCGEKYRVQFWAWREESCFYLKRKTARLKPKPSKQTRSMTRKITSCELVSSVPVRCIQVNSPSHQYLAGTGMVPTHNSEIAAGVALYCLIADGEEGAEIYGAACDRDQAGIVFHVAANMVRRSPYLSAVCRVIDSQKRIIVPSTGSFYRAIPADAAGAHGYNAHAVIVDELHAQPNRELWDVLTTSTAAREQPLVFAITTAGYDRTSICWEMHEYARRVLARPAMDPTFFAYIRSLPDDADWTDESLWHLANPALEGCGGGDFRSLDELRTAVAQAKERPAMENTVRRLYLSQWTQAEERWFRYGQWQSCGGLTHEQDWHGRVAFGGLDLASTSDFAAFVLVLPWADDDERGGGYDVLCRFWLPEAIVSGRRAAHADLIRAWAREGLLTLTPGDAIDYEHIKQQVLRDCADFDIRQIGYDPWTALQIAIQLEGELGDGVMVPVRQGYKTLSPPAKLLEALVSRRAINHGGHPVLAWMADNVVLERHPDEAIKPSKKKSSEKIDGVIALCTALERAMHEETPAEIAFVAFD